MPVNGAWSRIDRRPETYTFMLFEVLLKKRSGAGHYCETTVIWTVRELASPISKTGNVWEHTQGSLRDSGDPGCSEASADRHSDLTKLKLVFVRREWSLILT